MDQFQPTIQSVQTPPTTTEKPALNLDNHPIPPQKSPTIPILITLLILALSAAGYFFYQTQMLSNSLETPFPTTSPTPAPSPDPTANWLTYQNTNLGFSFSYPPTMEIDDQLQTSTDPREWTTKKSLTLSDSETNCNFSLMINPDGFGPNFPNKTEQVSYHDDKGFTIDQTIENTENLTPNLYTVIYTSAAAPKINENIHGIWSQASCQTSSTAPEYIDNTFSQILSTFKFTSAQPSADISNWKTYTNNTYHYTIKYPTDWTIDDSKANDNSYAPIRVAKSNYFLEILFLEGFGPSGCYFDDQTPSENPMIEYCEGEFVEFDNGLKRRLTTPNGIDSGDVQWPIYTKEKQSGYFVTVPPTSYIAPVNYESEVIMVMDKILETFQSTK